tara:strand:+ start:225 stop:680 length:456 start_codon:yes stop_codon:yes gene_type:complete
MKIESYKRSVLLTGTGVDDHRNRLRSAFQAKKVLDPDVPTTKKGLVVSKKQLPNMLAYLKNQKVRVHLNDALKTKQNVSVKIQKKPKAFKPMSEPMLRFYISTMFQKPNSTFAKDQLQAHGYTKANVVKEIKRIPFEKQKVYLKTIHSVWS